MDAGQGGESFIAETAPSLGQGMALVEGTTIWRNRTACPSRSRRSDYVERLIQAQIIDCIFPRNPAVQNNDPRVIGTCSGSRYRGFGLTFITEGCDDLQIMMVD